VKIGPPNDSPQDARLDENDPVWRLLARAPRPEPEAWFAARTLARCRSEGVETGANAWAQLPRFAQMWRWALSGGVAVFMMMAFAATQIHSHSKMVAKQQTVQQAFEIMASFDTDSDSSSSSSTSWQDSSL
jgi:anti-sigma-K factor RskA